MADLIAQGEEAQQRWRRALPQGEHVVLGRSAGAWAVPWDQHVSRHHADLLWNGESLEVAGLPDVRNPVFFRGRELGRFTVKPGEYFVIGHPRSPSPAFRCAASRPRTLSAPGAG
jgi:hypothetical protein